MMGLGISKAGTFSLSQLSHENLRETIVTTARDIRVTIERCRRDLWNEVELNPRILLLLVFAIH
jgi:hypothetical protein